MERLGGSTPNPEYIIDYGVDVDFGGVIANRGAYGGCLVGAILDVNSGAEGARENVLSTIVTPGGRDFVMACGKCSLALLQDNGIVYGASKCPEVRSGGGGLAESA